MKMFFDLSPITACFLSHLSGDEDDLDTFAPIPVFLSHLSGDEAGFTNNGLITEFLSHLSGDEVH
tara:strand:+ start:796 stop:990 length:195 start_codon:yes stop_codon:yes gene_type:complete